MALIPRFGDFDPFLAEIATSNEYVTTEEPPPSLGITPAAQPIYDPFMNYCNPPTGLAEAALVEQINYLGGSVPMPILSAAARQRFCWSEQGEIVPDALPPSFFSLGLTIALQNEGSLVSALENLIH